MSPLLPRQISRQITRLAFACAVALLPGGLMQAPPVQAQETAQEQFALAERHHDGNGVLQNFQTAAHWYGLAAGQGHAGAQNRLGQYFHAGLAGTRDQALALRWLQAAADQGDPQHLYDLALALEQGADGSSDPGRAATYYTRAADAGHVEAAVSLGVLYQNGTGVAQDAAHALALYEGAARTGNARAQNNLGLLYVRGAGVEQDYARAAQLFAAAAEQGMPTAIANLATMYANGFGVEQSDARAAALEKQASQIRQDQIAGGGSSGAATSGCAFDPRLAVPAEDPATLEAEQRAAAGGDPVALFLQGWRQCSAALAQGASAATRIPDLRAAARHFREAAERGHGPSMAALGQLHIRGLGMPQDYMQGYMWLILAGSAGVDGIPAQSAALRQRMTSNQVSQAQTRAAAFRDRQPAR